MTLTVGARRRARPVSGVGWRPEISGWVAGPPGLAVLRGHRRVPRSRSSASRGGGAAGAGCCRGPARGPALPGRRRPARPGRVTHLAACADGAARAAGERARRVRAGRRARGRAPAAGAAHPRARWTCWPRTSARTQAELDVPLALEPIAALFDWPEDEFTEADFLTELLERTGALLLLDVANVYANASTAARTRAPRSTGMPLDRIALRARRGRRRAPTTGIYHDTHTDPVPDAVLALLGELVDAGGAPAGDARTRRPLPARRRADRRARPRSPPRPASVTGPVEPVNAAEASPMPAAAIRRSPRRQAELVAALVAGGPDPDRLRPRPARRHPARAAAQARRRGREGWPLLAASLGERWPAVFAEHRAGPGARRRPARRLGRGPRNCARPGELTARPPRELAEREAELRYDGALGHHATPRLGSRRAGLRRLGVRSALAGVPNDSPRNHPPGRPRHLLLVGRA